MHQPISCFALRVPVLPTQYETPVSAKIRLKIHPKSSPEMKDRKAIKYKKITNFYPGVYLFCFFVSGEDLGVF